MSRPTFRRLLTGLDTVQAAAHTEPPHGAEGQGAPPTNRAPYNCIDTGFKAFRYGIDSVYLSFAGKLAPDWAERLRELKTKAQSDDDREVALAQVKIGPHLLEVADKAKRPFAFTLVDNCFHIQVSSGKAAAVPLAYVQISSEYLAAVGVEAAEADLRFIVNTLGFVNGSALVSRADPFVDFVCNVDLDQFDAKNWITRAHVLSKIWHRGRFSGFSIGRGGDLSSRLYDKRWKSKSKAISSTSTIFGNRPDGTAHNPYTGRNSKRVEVCSRRCGFIRSQTSSKRCHYSGDTRARIGLG